MVTGQESNTKKFKDDAKHFTISLPSDWYQKVDDDGKTLKILITKEYLLKANDKFEVGVELSLTRRISKNFPTAYSNMDFIKAYEQEISIAEQSFSKIQFIRNGHFNSGDFKGRIYEKVIKTDDYSTERRQYLVIMVNNDTMVTALLEAPLSQWNNYTRVFDQGLMSLIIKL